MTISRESFTIQLPKYGDRWLIFCFLRFHPDDVAFSVFRHMPDKVRFLS